MMKLIEPTILKRIFSNDTQVERVKQLLADNWEAVNENHQFMTPQITPETLQLAKQLLDTGLIESKVDFNDYQSVQAFILRNNSYINASVRRILLAPFE